MFLDRICEHTFISDILSSNSLVVDLGMNNGHFAYEIRRKYDCEIIGIEPNPVLYDNIIQSERLRCYNFAIANDDLEEVDFYVDEDDSESSSIFLETGTKIKVPSTTLAKFTQKPAH